MEENKETLNIANELLQEMKLAAKRAHIAVITVAALWFLTIAAFIWYLYQYDFTATIEQTGVYTLLDSRGNVISSDLTADDIIEIERILEHGENQGNEEQN
ncbi:MAG: hypothetical protein NC517_06535 [Firmicutes bacterium]|nr:hypothetical protein [Bacillota bacterium]